jgi:hypothetical protein
LDSDTSSSTESAGIGAETTGVTLMCAIAKMTAAKMELYRLLEVTLHIHEEHTRNAWSSNLGCKSCIIKLVKDGCGVSSFYLETASQSLSSRDNESLIRRSDHKDYWTVDIKHASAAGDYRMAKS